MNERGWLGHREGIAEIERLGRERVPFLFILSYDK